MLDEANCQIEYCPPVAPYLKRLIRGEARG